MVPARAPCGAFRVGLSAPQAASLRIVDASRGVARRRDGGRSAAPSVGLPSASCSVGLGVAVAGWAAAVRLRPSLRDVDRRGCGRPLLPVPIGHVGKAGVLEAPGLWRFGLARRGDPRPCTDGGDVERLAIYCTLKTIEVLRRGLERGTADVGPSIRW